MHSCQECVTLKQYFNCTFKIYSFEEPGTHVYRTTCHFICKGYYKNVWNKMYFIPLYLIIINTQIFAFPFPNIQIRSQQMWVFYGSPIFITSNPKYVVSSANGLFFTNGTYNFAVLHLFNHVTVHLEFPYIKKYKDWKIKPLFSKCVKCHSITG